MDRMKKKNLLLSYYNKNGEGSAGIRSNVDFSSTSSLTAASIATNSSFNSSENANTPTNSASGSKDPYDLNSTSFESDLFLKRLIKERTLNEIMDIENEIVKETRKLDSEMQTLVSENYNKFISATDTIRKMRSDFKKMEEEMEHLVVSMGEITEFNEKINCSFKDRRKEISRLSGIDNLLKKVGGFVELSLFGLNIPLFQPKSWI